MHLWIEKENPMDSQQQFLVASGYVVAVFIAAVVFTIDWLESRGRRGVSKPTR